MSDDLIGIQDGKTLLHAQYENIYKNIESHKTTIQRPYPIKPRLPLIQISLARCINVNDDICVKIAQLCPLIRSFSVAQNNDVTDRGIAAIARGCGGLLRIDISGLNRISDLALNALSFGCKDLKNIALSNCNSVSDNGLFKIFAIGKLDFLDIGACNNITENVIFAALHHLKNLVSITFTFKNEMYERLPNGLKDLKKQYPAINFECRGTDKKITTSKII